MIRLLGAITGSALALAALLVFVGVPQFKAKPAAIEREIVTFPLRNEPAAEPPIEPAAEAMQAAQDSTIETPQATETRTSDLTEQTVANSDLEPAPLLAEAMDISSLAPATPIHDPLFPESDDYPEAPADAVALSSDTPALTPNSLQWYAFWSPFRSEIAANGFVEQLQRVTGLDYRVVKIKPGVYEVAFGYVDDVDISLNLSQISAATGLDMPEG